MPQGVILNKQKITYSAAAPIQNTSNATAQIQKPKIKQHIAASTPQKKSSIQTTNKTKVSKKYPKYKTKKYSKSKKIAKSIPQKPIEASQEILNSQLVEQPPVFDIEQEPKEEISTQEVEKINQEELTQQEAIEQNIISQESQSEILEEDNQDFSFITTLKEIIKEKIPFSKSEFKNLVFFGGISFITFLAILILLNKKQRDDFKLKKKKELQDKNKPDIKKNITFQPNSRGAYIVSPNRKQIKKNPPKIQTPQNNIQINEQKAPTPQTTSAPIKRNYELNAFEPASRLNNSSQNNLNKKESEILDKILNDGCSKIEKTKQPNLQPKQNKLTQNQKPQTKKTPSLTPVKVNQNQEPKIISKVEIAPERGFMCVSYNNNINLMGYIFEDVFPLYNFKRSNLNNYEIKYRLTDKDSESANFIVKIDNTKLVIKATKQNMNLEVLI